MHKVFDKKIVLTRIVLPAHVLCIVASLVELSFASMWPKFIMGIVNNTAWCLLSKKKRQKNLAEKVKKKKKSTK